MTYLLLWSTFLYFQKPFQGCLGFFFVFQLNTFETRVLHNSDRRANEILTAQRNKSRTSMKERGGNFCVHVCGYLFYPESLLWEERNLKISTAFLPISSLHTYMPQEPEPTTNSPSQAWHSEHSDARNKVFQQGENPLLCKTAETSVHKVRNRTETLTEIPERNRIECTVKLQSIL